MNSLLRNVAGILGILITCALLYAFRVVPVSKIWRGYSVLYVEASADEGAVMSCLEQSGCSDVIALSVQRVPFVSQITPVHVQTSSYMEDRSAYFFDQSRQYRLFYVPDSQEKELSDAVKSLQVTLGVGVGVDGKTDYPWIVPVVCAVVFAVLLAFSRNRLVFLLGGIAPLLFTLSNPLYPSAAAVLLLLCALFLAERVWRRKGSIRAVFTSVYVVALCASALIIVSLVSLKSALLFLLSVLAASCALLMLRGAAIRADGRRAFTFVPIFSAKQIALVGRRRAVIMGAVAVPIAALLVLYVFSSRLLPASSVSGLSLPSPLAEDEVPQADEVLLPSVTDYFAWMWQAVTFQYRNLNDGVYAAYPAEGESLSVPRYTRADGTVQKTMQVLYVYDDTFRRYALDMLTPTDVESLLVTQGGGAAYRTRTKSEGGIDLRHVFLLLAATGVPLLLYAYYYLFGRRHENGS